MTNNKSTDKLFNHILHIFTLKCNIYLNDSEPKHCFLSHKKFAEEFVYA